MSGSRSGGGSSRGAGEETGNESGDKSGKQASHGPSEMTSELSGESADRKDSVAKKKAYWRSRRGMQELDVLLLPFVEQAYDALPVNLQASYHEFIDCEDWSLFDWLQGRAVPEREDFRDLVARILAHRA